MNCIEKGITKLNVTTTSNEELMFCLLKTNLNTNTQ